MDGGRKRSGLGFCFVFIQLGSPCFGSSHRSLLRDANGEESGKDGKDDLGKHASEKEEDTKHKMDKLPDRNSLNGSINDRSRVRGLATEGGSRPWSALTGGQLFLDGWIRGRLARSQGGLNRLRCLVVTMMSGRNLRLMILLCWMQRLCLSLDGVQGRGRRRGKQIVAGRSCNSIVLGKEGEMDIPIGLGEVVDW